MTMTLDDSLLMAFADGELDAATMRQVEAIIAGNTAARGRVQMFRATADWMRCAFPSQSAQSAPPAAKIVAIKPVPAPAKRASWRLTMPVAASIAAMFVAGAVGYSLGNLRADQQAGGRHQGDAPYEAVPEIIEYYRVVAEDNRHMVERGADAVAELETWFSERLKQKVRIPDLSAGDLAFRGGRMMAFEKAVPEVDGFKGQALALLVYDSPDGVTVGLNLAPADWPGDRAPKHMKMYGINAVHWVRNGILYALTSDGDADRLAGMIALIDAQIASN
jgi:anti-sigma factor RsiW